MYENTCPEVMISVLILVEKCIPFSLLLFSVYLPNRDSWHSIPCTKSVYIFRYLLVPKNQSIFEVLCNISKQAGFFGEVSLASRPTPKLEDHPLSVDVTAYSEYSQVPS
jgi:hypothetical protein